MGNPQTGVAGHAVVRTRLCNFYTTATWIEGRATDQLRHVSTWAGMQAIAAFPDLHPGRHGPVGAAFLADRIYPQLIGPDIGCGMALFRLGLPRRKLKLDKTVRRLREIEEPMDGVLAQSSLEDAGIAGRATAQGLGTIGGGNHFCEVQGVEEILDAEAAMGAGLGSGDLCLLVHSGSRGLGAAIFRGIESTWADGFDTQSPDALSYLAAHDVAVRWARLNRLLIAERAAAAIGTSAELICDAVHNLVTPFVPSRVEAPTGNPDTEASPGATGWLHRKGAAAPDGGLVPLAGSREHLSYLLRVAPGRDDALQSVSHGAGRRYDRAAMHGRAGRTRSELDAMQRNRFGGHVVCEDKALLIEEAGPAYKSSGDVARDLASFGLANGVVALAPLLTFKTARAEAAGGEGE